MADILTDTEIRPFRPTDRAAIVAFRNAHRPAHLHETVAEWERRDADRPADEIHLRLCVGDPPAAFLSAADRGTSAWRKPGVCSFNLSVGDDGHWESVSAALYERAVAFAHGRGLGRLETHIRLFRPDEPLAAFLDARGFQVIDREVPVMLDLTAFDPAPFRRPTPEGLRLVSLAQAGDTDENRRRVWALDGAVNRDIPTNGGHSEHPPFEQWRKMLDGPEFDPDAVILAEDAATGEWVGLSILSFHEGTNIAETNITGVLPDYRGRGLALALKLRAIDAALARGCPLILTENHEDNAPMRAINRKLGFVPDAPGVSYAKTF